MKNLDMSKISTNLESTFYVEKEIQDVKKKYYLRIKNLKSTVSFSFV